MFSIKDPTLKRMVLEHLIEQMDSSPELLDALLCSGVDADILDMLRHRPVRDLMQAARMEDLLIAAAIDPDSLRRCFERVDVMRREIELREYFMVNAASSELMHRLFKVSKDEYAELRHFLRHQLDQAPTKGRWLPVEKRDEIQRSWHEIKTKHAELPTRDQIHKLHQVHSDVGFDGLWAAIKEYDEMAAPPSSSRTVKPLDSTRKKES